MAFDVVCQNCMIILSNTQHLGGASHCWGNALSLVLDDRHWMLLRLILPQKDWEVWRRLFVFPPCFLFLLQWVLSPGWTWCWKNNLCGIQPLSTCREYCNLTHQFGNHVFTCVSLNLHGCTSRNFRNSRNTRTSSCYFLHKCVEANLFLRNLVLLGYKFLLIHFDWTVYRWAAPSDSRSSWS